MKLLLGLRVLLALLIAVLMPLGQAYCALTMSDASAAAVHAGPHAGDDHECCPEPASHSGSPLDQSCCDLIQFPAATAPASLSLGAPVSVSALIAVVPAIAEGIDLHGASTRFEPDARSGAPPDPPTAPQAPRGPPYSAQHPVLILR